MADVIVDPEIHVVVQADPDATEVIYVLMEGPQGPPGPQGDMGLNWRGAWDIAEEYKTDDAVSHAGSSWIANADNVGAEPGVDPEWDLWVTVGDIDGGTLA